jgi:ribose transport system permease protein
VATDTKIRKQNDLQGKEKRISGAVKLLGVLNNYRGILALVAVFIYGVMTCRQADGTPIFLTVDGQANILFECAEYGILAAGMTLVILTAGIDLAVGSVLGFVAMLFSLLVVGYGWSPLPAIAASVVAGTLTGCISGALISYFNMQPFVATLAMMVAARGGAKLITGGVKVAPGAFPWFHMKEGTPALFDWMTTKSPMLLGFKPAAVLFLIVIAILFVVVRYTRFGRNLYAIGGNEEAARLSGIRVGSNKIAAYAICGATAALAGIVNASRQTLGDPEAGSTYELDAIAAVVIGGTSLMGGKGGMLFTLIGTLIIAYITKILSFNNVEIAYRLIAKGLIIVAAVLIQQGMRKKA